MDSAPHVHEFHPLNSHISPAQSISLNALIYLQKFNKYHQDSMQIVICISKYFFLQSQVSSAKLYYVYYSPKN
jgi:hypothetical protein